MRRKSYKVKGTFLLLSGCYCPACGESFWLGHDPNEKKCQNCKKPIPAKIRKLRILKTKQYLETKEPKKPSSFRFNA
jgi:hypothetical protein